jgi:site-specific DNA-methyltransferase (adenine-specific)
VPTPYYADDLVTLFHGKCEDITDWLAADVLVTDPPYGRAWRQGESKVRGRHGSKSHAGIAGDAGTELRDWALDAWGSRVAVVFGDLMLAPAPGTKLVLPYCKAVDAGVRGAIGGFRRDAEAIYLIGPWPTGLGGRSSVIRSNALGQGNLVIHHGHPHAKPVDVMEDLIRACPDGVIADPFAGAGSTLVAARNLGRRVVGVELEEKYCERAARRLSQMTLDIPA